MVKTDDSNIKCFEQAVSAITADLKKLLLNLDDKTKERCTEIRLRINRPVALMFSNELYYLLTDSNVTKDPNKGYICNGAILNDTFARMCGYSIHTYQSDIVNGFITLEGGHRAGVCGTAAVDSKGNILSVRDISSINIRVAKEIVGCSDKIADEIFRFGSKSLIIAGPPSSGKTTVLRDLVRTLSDSGKKVCLIDERYEIACTNKGAYQKNIGINTDIYSGYPKEKVLNIAVRTMSPDYIAVDEVCDDSEINAIKIASNCGVKMLVTVHASDFKEVVSRLQIISLIRTNAFDKLVLLNKNPSSGIVNIYDIGEINDEIYRCRSDMDELYLCRDEGVAAI